jgi:DMSO/TMAO reductase YedYZ molybdopterin-dependent catalytic subunit
MPFPRVRFTVRRMMVAVAILAAILAAFEAGRRWERNHRPRGLLRIQAVRHVGQWGPGRATALPVAPDPPEPE